MITSNELQAFQSVVASGLTGAAPASWPVLQGWLSRPMSGIDELFPIDAGQYSMRWPTLVNHGVLVSTGHGRCKTFMMTNSDVFQQPGTAFVLDRDALEHAAGLVRMFLHSIRHQMENTTQVAVHLRMPAAGAPCRALVALTLLKAGVAVVFPDIVHADGTSMALTRNPHVAPCFPLWASVRIEDRTSTVRPYAPAAGPHVLWNTDGTVVETTSLGDIGAVPPVLAAASGGLDRQSKIGIAVMIAIGLLVLANNAVPGIGKVLFWFVLIGWVLYWLANGGLERLLSGFKQ